MPISPRPAYVKGGDCYLLPRHRYYNLTPTQRYREILFEKWTMSAIWLYNMQKYWSDKNPGTTLLFYPKSEDTREDLQLRIRFACDCLVDQWGPIVLNGVIDNHLVDRYGPRAIPCEFTETALLKILLDTNSVALIR
jgi:hypothetical protein